MIPLSRWLEEQSTPAVEAASVTEWDDCSLCGNEVDIEAPSEMEAAGPSREEELLSELSLLKETISKLTDDHAAREQELLHRFGDELSRRLQGEVGQVLESVLAMLEDSLSQVLMPFLAGEVRVRAVSELLELIRRELRQSEEPILEIRAPAALHDAMRQLGERAEVSITVTESETVDIILATQKMRFEELSSRWCAAIWEGQP